MKATSGTHWFGVLLLFITSMLLLIVTLSAPIINHLGLLNVRLYNSTKIQDSYLYFGTFGHCTSRTALGGDYCTPSTVGYSPARTMSQVDKTGFGYLSAGTSDSLTRTMVLHPVACGLAFVAFLLSLGAGAVGSLLGASVAFVTWVLIVVAMACDFTIFSIVRRHMNHQDKTTSVASYGSAIWMLVAAFVLEFLGMAIVFFTCLSERKEKKRGSGVGREKASGGKKKFGLF